MLDIRNLCINFEKINIVHDLNLNIEKGEICAILGYSGCGKTSILNAIAKNIKYDGEILIDNKAIDFKRNRIEYVEQSYQIFTFMSVFENIVFGLKLKKIEYDENKIKKLCQSMGIIESLDKYPKKISGGQRQRAALIRSLVINPELLLLDEPFSALDYLTKEKIQKEFLNYVKLNNITCLFITHNIDEAVILADKIVVLDKNPSIIKSVIKNEEKFPRDTQQYMDKVMELRKILIKTGEIDD